MTEIFFNPQASVGDGTVLAGDVFGPSSENLVSASAFMNKSWVTSNPDAFSICKRDGVGSVNGTNITATGALYTDAIFSRGTELDIGSNSTNLKLGCGAGVQTVDIGSSGGGVTTINVGGVGDTVNISGNLTYINSTNTQITDRIVTLNKNGAAASSGGSGLEFEEAGVATGAYMRISSGRDKIELKAPIGSAITLNQSLATTDAPTFGALTCPSVTTATNQLLLTQTGDIVGTSGLLICNRDGANGCVVRQLNVGNDLCDIGLYSQANGQTATIRMEKRLPQLVSSSNITYGEIQFRPNTALVGQPAFSAGYAQCTVLPTSLLSTGAIMASGSITTSAIRSSAARKVLTFSDLGNPATQTQQNYDGFGNDATTVIYQAKNMSTNHTFYAATSSTTSTGLMRVNGSGVVDFFKSIAWGGTSNTMAQNKFIAFRDYGSLTDTSSMWFTGFGAPAGQLSYQLAATTDAHVFNAWTGSEQRELMRITGAGAVSVLSGLSAASVTTTGVITGSSLVATGDASATYTCNWGGAMTGYTTSIRFVRKNDIVTVKMITSPGATGTGAGGAITCVPGIAAGFLPSGGDYLLNVIPLSLNGATVFVNGVFSLDPAGVLLIDMPGSGATWTGNCIIGGFSTCYPI